MSAGARLLDTGALVALLSARDSAHERCRRALEEFRGRLYSTEAVLTEALYVLRGSLQAQANCIDFMLQGGAILIPSTAATLRRCRALMADYADLPMDFADATLVALAEISGIGTILTLGRRDFSIYRWGRKRRFVILP